MDAADITLCAALRGTGESWRGLADAAAESRFLEAAARHRLRPLLSWQLHRSGDGAQWPPAIRRALVDAERAEAALEVVRQRELVSLLAAFAAVNVPVLLFKGAALAYSLYPAPWLRPREDADLLVHDEDRPRAEAILAAAGFGVFPSQSGALVAHQRLFVRRDAAGRRHAIDLHWKIANPAPFADLVTPAELFAAADVTSIDGRQPARMPSRVHALLIACWHRVAHHRDSADLLWLYDVHLLADGMTPAESVQCAAMANRTGTAAICARAFTLAQTRFGTRLDPALGDLRDLRPEGRSYLRSHSDAYLRSDASRTELLIADLRALPDLRSRLRLVREHLFPPPGFMRAAHGPRGWLPLLYARRIARGARDWLRRPAR